MLSNAQYAQCAHEHALNIQLNPQTRYKNIIQVCKYAKYAKKNEEKIRKIRRGTQKYAEFVMGTNQPTQKTI